MNHEENAKNLNAIMDETIQAQKQTNELSRIMSSIQTDAVRLGSQTSILADSIAALGKIAELSKHVTNIQSNTQRQLKSLQTSQIPNHEISRLTPTASEHNTPYLTPVTAEVAEQYTIAKFKPLMTVVESSPIANKEKDAFKRKHESDDIHDNQNIKRQRADSRAPDTMIDQIFPIDKIEEIHLNTVGSDLAPSLNVETLFTRIFIGRLSSEIKENDVRTLFQNHGEITNIDLRNNFAFLTYLKKDSAEQAVKHLDGYQFGSYKIEVNMARPITCFNCREQGHLSTDCKKPRRTRPGNPSDNRGGRIGKGRNYF